MLIIKCIREVDTTVNCPSDCRVRPGERSEIGSVVNIFIARVDEEVESRAVREEGTIVII